MSAGGSRFLEPDLGSWTTRVRPGPNGLSTVGWLARASTEPIETWPRGSTKSTFILAGDASGQGGPGGY